MRNKKRKTDLGLNLTRTIFTKLTSTNLKTRRRSNYLLKNGLDFSELCSAVDFIDRNVNASFQDLIFGNATPKSYSELGKCEFSILTKDLLHEVNWTLISFRKYSNTISNFLFLKDKFEQYFIRSNYFEAEKVITKIEQTVCYSLWTLEARFLIGEYTNGTSENKELLSLFNAENQSFSYTKSLAHYLSLRSEKSLSVNRFNADLENALGKIQGTNAQKHKEYYLFKLSFLNYLKFNHYQEIIAYDFQNSIIDRYLNFRKVLISLLLMANENEESKGEHVRKYLISRINYLIKKINDPLLYQIKLFAGDKLFPSFNTHDVTQDIDAIDDFTKGHYEDAERKLRDLLERKPLNFDLYELYARTLVLQRKGFIAAGNPKSIQNQILNGLYQIISYQPEYTEAGINLLRIANNLSNCILSYGITDFVINQTQGKQERRLLSRLSFNTANPIVYEVFSDQETKSNYLLMLQDKFPNSLTINIASRTFADSSAIIDFQNDLPDLTYKLSIARYYLKSGDLDTAIKIWEYILFQYKEISPAYEEALINLFVCYQILNRYDDAVKLFVDSFFINPLIISKINVLDLLKRIRESRFKIVSPTIDLPLFYTICNGDENETHTAFERYNLSQSVCKPSEIIQKLDPDEGDKLFFYLKFTCGPEILKHSTHIRGSKERLEERLKIVQFLREKDTLDKNFYDDEIKYISNILVIQKGLMELDESKIYVNEQGIISNELKEYDAIYQRYKAIGKIAQKSELWMLDTTGRLTTVNYTEDGAESSDREYSSNPVYDVYYELFEAIKSKFLYSKFGIVAYLSTRIRHGVLLGEIRPIFEKHRLITLREGDTANYRRNYHWDGVYQDVEDITLARIQEYLKEFSYSVDGLIFDLIKKYLQVYDKENNPDGWFNYDFSDDHLFWFAIRELKTRDFSHFSQQIFEILWERTDQNLSLIREKIQEDTSQKFNRLFDQLEMDISRELPGIQGNALVGAIKACSTEIHTTITRISRWFKRSGTTASDFLLRDLIDIVMEYTNKSKSNRIVDLQLDIQFNQKLKGEYLTHFADLFRIFTENILKHAGDNATRIPCSITTSLVDSNQLVIAIENDITDKAKIDALKNVWHNRQIDVLKLVSEDKSGYHKALKILKSDLRCEQNNLITEISDDDEKYTIKMFIDVRELTA